VHILSEIAMSVGYNSYADRIAIEFPISSRQRDITPDNNSISSAYLQHTSAANKGLLSPLIGPGICKNGHSQD